MFQTRQRVETLTTVFAFRLGRLVRRVLDAVDTFDLSVLSVALTALVVAMEVNLWQSGHQLFALGYLVFLLAVVLFARHRASR